jgi:cytochrome b561
MTTFRLAEKAQDRAQGRYSVLSISLHWTIAALILLQMVLGWIMNEAVPDHSRTQDQIQAIHISVGLTVLLLVFVRIGARLLTPVPALPQGMPSWERLLAHALHALFYVLMLLLPLTGWLLVSVRHEPIAFWGLPWPYLPGLEGVSGPAHKAFGKAVKHFHVFTQIWIAWAMIALHVTGAVKHQFDGRPVLWRMVPFLSKPRPSR